MKINYGEIYAIGLEVLDARNYFCRKYPGPQYITHDDAEMYDAYRRMEAAERAADVVCDVLGIPHGIPAQAARIINRAYDRAYNAGRDPGMIDEEHVIISLIANY